MQVFVSRILLPLVLVLLSAVPGAGQEILILGNESKIPKIYLDGGSPRGILIDICKAIDNSLDEYTFHYELYPWARAYRMAEMGQGGIIGLSMTKERLEIFDYSDPVYYDDVIVVVRKDNTFPFHSIDDLQGKVVGIGLAGTFGDEFDQAVETGLFTVDPDNGDIPRLKKLLSGRIDCALISPGVSALEHVISKDEFLRMHREEFLVLPIPFKRDPNYLGFACSMDMKPFLKAFNQALGMLQNSGELQGIIRSHLHR